MLPARQCGNNVVVGRLRPSWIYDDRLLLGCYGDRFTTAAIRALPGQWAVPEKRTSCRFVEQGDAARQCSVSDGREKLQCGNVCVCVNLHVCVCVF